MGNVPPTGRFVAVEYIPRFRDGKHTTMFITVGPNEPARAVAGLRLDNGISWVPVIDTEGTPIGMASEGDLIDRDEMDRLSRDDWWLPVMTGTQALDDEFLARLRTTNRTARDVTSAPLVTVTEQTDVADIARLLGNRSHQACSGGT